MFNSVARCLIPLRSLSLSLSHRPAPVCVYTCTHIHACDRVCDYCVCVGVCEYICTDNTCVYACVYVCMFVCLYVNVCLARAFYSTSLAMVGLFTQLLSTFKISNRWYYGTKRRGVFYSTLPGSCTLPFPLTSPPTTRRSETEGDCHNFVTMHTHSLSLTLSLSLSLVQYTNTYTHTHARTHAPTQRHTS